MRTSLVGKFLVLVMAALLTSAGVAAANVLSKQKAAAKPVSTMVQAYAFVIPGEVSLTVDPLLITERTKGFTGVTSPQAGVFCLALAEGDPTKMSWSVTPEYSRSSVGASKLLLAYADVSSACGPGNVRVRTFQGVTGSANVIASEGVAFMVVAAA